MGFAMMLRPDHVMHPHDPLSAIAGSAAADRSSDEPRRHDPVPEVHTIGASAVGTVACPSRLDECMCSGSTSRHTAQPSRRFLAIIRAEVLACDGQIGFDRHENAAGQFIAVRV